MKKLRFKRDSLLKKIIIVALLVFVVYNVFKIAILFRKDDNRDLVVCIHNEVGVSLTHKPIIEDNIVYLSEADMKKYFDDKEKKLQSKVRLRVKKLRLDNNKTQQELAKYLGVDKSTYNKYENGKRKFNNDVVNQLAEYYSIKVSDIVD